MMNHHHLKKLHRMFSEKMAKVYEENARPDMFSDARIFEFNARQSCLRNTPSLEAVDVEEGERPGFMRVSGQVAAMRIPNPSNRTGHGREFIVVPYDLGEKCLTLDWIPERWPPRDE